MLLNDSPAVPATVELYLSGGLNGSARIYHYFVPPVQTMTIALIYLILQLQKPKQTWVLQILQEICFHTAK